MAKVVPAKFGYLQRVALYPATRVQYIDQIRLRIDAVQPARDDQTLHDTHVLRPKLGPAFQFLLPALHAGQAAKLTCSR